MLFQKLISKIGILLVATVIIAWSVREKPSIYLVGDSTVANGNGWGKYLPSLFDISKINIHNYAVGGTSSRTFQTNGVWETWRMKNGMWDSVFYKLKKGDYVLIQFGHNDAAKLDDTARARGSIKGIGDERKEIYNPITKKKETVYTYGWYLRKFINDAKSKGAIPILCSLIPRNKWSEGKVYRSNHDYTKWAKEVALQTNTGFIDLNNLVADIYDQEGEAAVKAKYFGTDPVHPNSEGSKLNAIVVAKQIKRLKISNISKYLLNAPVKKDTSLTLNKKDNGYRGIWYGNQPSKDEYVYKYSGGLGTYPANHYPFSVYVAKVNKTFFCYGGTDNVGKTLLHMVSYYDHKTGLVPQPTVVLDKQTNDAHDNPVMNIDEQGYIWIFSTSHGTERPSFIHKSVKPYDISKFENVKAVKQEGSKQVTMDNFSYVQAWYQKEKGFFNLFTHYDTGAIPNQPKKLRRIISYTSSKDGLNWAEWKDIAMIEEGHYQTSGMHGNKIATTFNFHPVTTNGYGLNYRSNLYYIETTDFGQTWKSIDGKNIDLPLTSINNHALIKDYYSLGKNVYINDIAFDSKGLPVILFITSKGFEAGPENGPQEWFTARYTGSKWDILPLTSSDNNYDMGSLYVEKDGTWRVIAPTIDGPQKFNTGGEIAMWVSTDLGKHWKNTQLTKNSLQNHSYPRKPVNSHEDFYAFWADGNGRKPSESRLYFSNKKGEVFILPSMMKSSFVKPIKVKND